MIPDQQCQTCLGCGKVADTDDQEPWAHWESLPAGNDIAVRIGLVNPIPCPTCATQAPADD